MIHSFFDEDHFPALKTLLFENYIYHAKLSEHLTVWKRHRGVQILDLEMDYNWTMDAEFSEKLVQLFPAVTKFNLLMHVTCDTTSPEIDRMMEPFQLWDLEEIDVLVSRADGSEVLVAVLRNMAMWKGKYLRAEDGMRMYIKICYLILPRLSV